MLASAILLDIVLGTRANSLSRAVEYNSLALSSKIRFKDSFAGICIGRYCKERSTCKSSSVALFELLNDVKLRSGFDKSWLYFDRRLPTIPLLPFRGCTRFS